MAYDVFPFMIFGWFPLLGILLFIALILLLLRRPPYFGGPFAWRDFRHNWRHTDEAMDILNKRYARGEITKEEYERIKKDLRG